ncbi:hypothetical protein ABZX30_21075 [Streptomyces sp. NPDC004542]|uniref:hypothetical protein n=1 Tax=Streptomyces sp. NPDC004542 TaxID=3154281 RepID=UPI0033A41CB5
MTLMTEGPVTSDAEPRNGFEELLDLLDELNVPDGYKAEIIRGSIVVSPWSKAYYADVMDMVCDQLRPLFWEPTPKGYQGRRTTSFGEKLYIPDPIGCTLDTTGFHAPASS